MFDQVSMAFMVTLQRLTPAERAVLLLRDVFEFDYSEIAALIEKSESACRKLLERARENVAREKRLFAASPEVHRRLLTAFHQAATAGGIDTVVSTLAEEAALITDGGPKGRRVGGLRNLQAPLVGARKIAAFAAATAGTADLETEIHELNGQPALVFYDEGVPFAALLLAIADDRIHRVFFHADLDRLHHLGPRNPRRCPVFYSKSTTMTREKSIYLASTGLVCGVMAFSAVNFNLANPLGPMKGAFVHLGYPSYFRIELTSPRCSGCWRS